MQVGLRVQGVTDIDQQAENFSIVATLQMQWQDLELGFQPESGEKPFRILRGNDFVEFVSEHDTRWPRFLIFNQQGKRFSQDTVALVAADGKVFYFERFTATLQAPYFQFSKFPFDAQEFYIDIDLLAPKEVNVWTELKGYSDLEKLLGLEDHSI